MYYIYYTTETHCYKIIQLCKITKDNQNDQNLVNYNKSYIGVKVTRSFGSTIGNYYIRVKVHDSNTVTLCPHWVVTLCPASTNITKTTIAAIIANQTDLNDFNVRGKMIKVTAE